MIELSDSIWKTLKGGYRINYDASKRLRELEGGGQDLTSIWDEFWQELHHQGDVDIASYATVPELVRICIKRGLMDWNTFALVACIEECRLFRKQNPALPTWLEMDYHSAIRKLAEFGAQHFSEDWSKELAESFLAVAAFAKGLSKQGRMLATFTDDELDEVFEHFY
jgi:hypothetical protein